ncbi:hypothetical protein [Spirosoma utsteinense]|uniref:Uncharacterized protein n=1 Tax=Spirosoma utsteinense TaxID=2585773 RepID=A0ABR6W687_9BACT|nr:hypothetical protein [Spirosoma utsteinense]MBC3785927.1 hypothetical protein [Spirosoma utsteinense]MBC3792097.1 hypothetical protein [Spirosoma utsteinense]
MEDFTPEQVTVIATGYQSMARALNEFQTRRWSEFSHEQQLDLNAYQNSLLNRAQDLQALVVRPAFNNTAEMTAYIVQALYKAEDNLKHIRNLTVALNVGAITVALASYVARANLRGIQTALRELGNLLVVEE